MLMSMLMSMLMCSGVIGGTSLLLHGKSDLTEEQREIVGVIRTSGEVMLTLINDILGKY